MRAAVVVGGEQPAVAPERMAHEVECPPRGLRELVAAERPRRNRHAANHQAIPRGENLVIPSGTYPFAAQAQQLLARRGQCRLDTLARTLERAGDVLHRAEDMQVPPALEVGLAIESEAGRKRCVFLDCQGGAHIVAVPDIEL